MIKPHGSDVLMPLYVSDDGARSALLAAAEGMDSLLMNSAAAANVVMLGAGYFNPLQGFMNLADCMSVARTLHTASGLFWPVPVAHLTDRTDVEPGQSLALRDPNVPGNPVMAIMRVDAVETVSGADIAELTLSIFGTADGAHPGVKTFNSLGRTLLSGSVQVLNFSYFPEEFPDTFRTAADIRREIGERGWKKVVAFQTRNPMHRAHEELCRMAKERLDADGIVIHMLLGKLKDGDIPAPVRDACIRKMVDVYFEPNTVMISGYGFDMLYAGPREAVLHAIFRQNMGANYLIVGRDHAGVGDYYGPFDAQKIFDDSVPDGALEISIFRADNTAFSKKLGRVVMMREAPDHGPDDFIQLSGTKVRQMLSQGIAPPPEFSRPEVAKVLMEYYQSLEPASGKH